MIYGGLIGIAVIMVQPLVAAPSLDASARISAIAFSVAIPLLAALVMVNRQEAFRRRRTPSVSVTIAQAIAQLAAFVGIVAGFWHIYWIAGVVFLAAGLVGVLVHSAGYWPSGGKSGPVARRRTLMDGRDHDAQRPWMRIARDHDRQRVVTNPHRYGRASALGSRTR